MILLTQEQPTRYLPFCTYLASFKTKSPKESFQLLAYYKLYLYVLSKITPYPLYFLSSSRVSTTQIHSLGSNFNYKDKMIITSIATISSAPSFRLIVDHPTKSTNNGHVNVLNRAVSSKIISTGFNMINPIFLNSCRT